MSNFLGRKTNSFKRVLLIQVALIIKILYPIRKRVKDKASHLLEVQRAPKVDLKIKSPLLLLHLNNNLKGRKVVRLVLFVAKMGT